MNSVYDSVDNQHTWKMFNDITWLVLQMQDVQWKGVKTNEFVFCNK